MSYVLINDDVASGLVIPADRLAYRLTGTATVLGDGRRLRMQVHDVTGRLLRTTYSAPDGSWQVDHVPYQRYLVIARDDHRNPQYNAAVSDFVTPEPME